VVVKEDNSNDFKAKDRLEHAVCIGDASKPPTIEEVLRLLRETGLNLVINEVGLNLSGRQRLFDSLITAMAELRARTGRPQWLLIDEAHHVLPEKAPSSGEPTGHHFGYRQS
jgi:hypothetical protein